MHEAAARLVERGWITREEIERDGESWIAYRLRDVLLEGFRERLAEVRERASRSAEEN